MAKKIHLWASPRNVSTAIMYSFAQRKECLVFDEPFYASYLKSTGIVHPGLKEILESQSTDFREVVEQVIEKQYKEKLVFFKQMSHHLLDHSMDFLLKSINIILIREPKDMILSFAKVIPEPSLEDLGLQQSHDIFQYLKSQNQAAIILNSGDLLENPREFLKLLCKRLDIEFDPNMLAWPAGARPEDGVWAPYWYAGVHRSTGFKSSTKKQEDLPKRHFPLYEKCLPLYLALQAESLKL